MWLIDLVGRLWAMVRGASAKQAAADVPRGEEIDRQLERDKAELEERAHGQ